METAFLLGRGRGAGDLGGQGQGGLWLRQERAGGRGGGWVAPVVVGRGGAGCVLLRFVLFFDFVVDVLVVQVVIWCLARCCARQGLWSRQCSPWCSAVAVNGQGGVMPVVATTGAWDLTEQKLWRFRSCSVYALLVQFIDGCGRPCAHAQTSFCVQFLDQVDMPVTVQRQVRSLCGDVVDTPVVAQTQIPMVRFTTEILQLQFVVQVRSSCAVVGDSRDPTVAARFFLGPGR